MNTLHEKSEQQKNCNNATKAALLLFNNHFNITTRMLKLLVRFKTLLDRISVLENLLNRFKSAAFSLREEAIDNIGRNHVEYQEECKKSPFECVNSLGKYIGLNDSGQVDKELGHGHSVGTGRVWENFYGVEGV
jgi:hypothetical protein